MEQTNRTKLDNKIFVKIFNKAIHRHLSKKPMRKIANKIEQFVSNSEHTIIKLNESEQFQTRYYHCMTDKAVNIPEQIGEGEFDRLLKGDKKGEIASANLSTIFDYLKIKEPEKVHEKMQKTDVILTDLNIWQNYYCQICHKFVKANHAHNESRKLMSATKLQDRIKFLRVHTKWPCLQRESCVFHMQNKIRYQNEEDLIIIQREYYLAVERQKKTQAKLQAFKCIINGEISYCVLKRLIWTGLRDEIDEPSCLELYFTVRKILGQPPLDEQPLDRQLVYSSIRRRRAVEYQLEKDDDCTVSEVMPANFFISKSQVCNGAGVFTKTALRKEMCIGTYAGQILNVSNDSSNKRSTYLGYIDLPSYNFQLDSQRDVDSCFYGNFTRLLNHMAEKYANCAFRNNDRKMSVEVYTIKDVTEGEQLFVDYGSKYCEPWKEEFDLKISRLHGAQSMNEAKNLNKAHLPSEDQENSSQQERIKERCVARKSVLSTTKFVKKSSAIPIESAAIVIDD